MLYKTDMVDTYSYWSGKIDINFFTRECDLIPISTWILIWVNNQKNSSLWTHQREIDADQAHPLTYWKDKKTHVRDFLFSKAKGIVNCNAKFSYVL